VCLEMPFGIPKTKILESHALPVAQWTLSRNELMKNY